MYDAANLVWKASEFAIKAHKGQTRKYTGNTLYITHCARVAARTQILSGYCKRDLAELVAIAWLHDTIEDCNVVRGDLTLEGFTRNICDGVEALTNPSKGRPELNRAARKEMDRNHLKGLSEPLKCIKLIDRIDNLKDLVWADPGFMQKYLIESDLLFQALKIQDVSLKDEYMYASLYIMNLVHQYKKNKDMEIFREVQY